MPSLPKGVCVSGRFEFLPQAPKCPEFSLIAPIFLGEITEALGQTIDFETCNPNNFYCTHMSQVCFPSVSIRLLVQCLRIRGTTECQLLLNNFACIFITCLRNTTLVKLGRSRYDYSSHLEREKYFNKENDLHLCPVKSNANEWWIT